MMPLPNILREKSNDQKKIHRVFEVVGGRVTETPN